VGIQQQEKSTHQGQLLQRLLSSSCRTSWRWLLLHLLRRLACGLTAGERQQMPLACCQQQQALLLLLLLLV
jgi:hypothetical protein